MNTIVKSIAMSQQARTTPRIVSKLEDLHFVNHFTRSVIADSVEENRLRQVPGAMFSYVNPTPIFDGLDQQDLVAHKEKQISAEDENKSSNSGEKPQLAKEVLSDVSKHWDLVSFSRESAMDCLHLQIPDSVLQQRQCEEHKTLLAYLSGSAWLPNSLTRYYAHAYSGHQFGHFASQLGDGRAISLGQVQVDVDVDVDGNDSDNGKKQQLQLWELQLKGAGQTPFSRRADGRAVLRSSVREYLASEAMYHLGIPTTRALSLVKSHDEVVPRDEFYNWNVQMEHAAIVLRMAPSFVRFGSFEHFFYRYRDGEKRRKEWMLIDQLMDYVITYHYPELLSTTDETESKIDRNVRLEFLREVVKRTAELYAKWQSVGFTHGVLNTDNNSILGLTIDYGPYGFMDYFDPDFVPNHSDEEGRYSYANQPQIGQWNCDKLLYCLSPSLFDFYATEDSTNGTNSSSGDGVNNDKPPVSAETFQELRVQTSQHYWNCFNAEYIRIMRNKLGIQSSSDASTSDDLKLVERLFDWMTESSADMTNLFRKLGNIKKDVPIQEQDSVLNDLFSTMPVNLETHQRTLKQWLEDYVQRLQLDTALSDEQRKELMDRTNPKYILRNWMAHEAIQKAKTGDYSQIEEIYQVLLCPFDEQSLDIAQKYAANAPEWAKALKCSCSS